MWVSGCGLPLPILSIDRSNGVAGDGEKDLLLSNPGKKKVSHL